jgi:hypothetical protein
MGVLGLTGWMAMVRTAVAWMGSSWMEATGAVEPGVAGEANT